jgi:hypothetical protein
MRRSWAALVVLLAVALSIGSGVAAGFAGRLLQQTIFAQRPETRVLGIFVASMLAVFLVFTVVKGLNHAFRHVLPVLIAILGLAALLALASGSAPARGGLGAVAFILAAVGIMGLGVLARTAAGTAGVLLFAVAAIPGALSGSAIGGGLTATAIAVAAMIAGRRALKRDDLFPVISRIAVRVACREGTSFRGADLSNATFAGSRLECCDFRGATTVNTRFAPASLRLCLFDGEPPEAAPPPGRSRSRLRSLSSWFRRPGVGTP